MPLAVSENPPELYVEGSAEPTLENIQGPICVVFTRSRQEKSLARSLQGAGIPYFLPYISRRDASRNVSVSPLFAGVLFAAAAHPSEPGLSPEIRSLASDKKTVGQLTIAQLESYIGCEKYPHCPFMGGEEFINEHRATFRILRPINQPRLRKELALLAMEPSNRRTAQIEPHQLKRGVGVRWVSGPMAGEAGKVSAMEPPKSNGKVRVHIDTFCLGQVISIETDPNQLEILQ